VYELLLADLRQIPVIGSALLRLHGLLSLWLYVIAIARSAGDFGSGTDGWRQSGRVGEAGDAGRERVWMWAVMLVVPAVFHQFVLVKNDLFSAIPGLVALTWVVARSRMAPAREVMWASWLAGFAVAIKVTNLPALGVLGVAVLARRQWQPILYAVLGALMGMLSGGLVFSCIQNFRLYGELMPLEGIGDRNDTAEQVLVSVGRFSLSLFDLGVVTRTLWPGRGGWGGTLGLPLIWSLAVLAWGWRQKWLQEAPRALLCAGACFLIFAVSFPDADLAHRLMLAPGLMLIAVAAHAVAHENTSRPVFTGLLGVVLVLSAAQIARSAFLYLMAPSP
jgi:hypothetical protein